MFVQHSIQSSSLVLVSVNGCYVLSASIYHRLYITMENTRLEQMLGPEVLDRGFAYRMGSSREHSV